MRRSVNSAVSFAKKMVPLSVKRKVTRCLSKFVPETGVTVLEDGRRYANTRERLFWKVYYLKAYEMVLTAFIKDFVEAGDNLVDVGANFGWYSVLFGMLSKTGVVHAFEPLPETCELLERNIAENSLGGVVTANKLCAGSAAGEVQMDFHSGESGLAKVSAADDGLSVPMVRLDTFLGEFKDQIALIKIDTEGYEPEVLAGAVGLLGGEAPPMILMELNDSAIEAVAGKTRQDLLSFLSEAGYSFWEVKESAEVVRTDGETCHDVICVPGGQFGERFMKGFGR